MNEIRLDLINIHFSGGTNCPMYVEDFKMVWWPMIAQKISLVCYRAGSDEIVGMHMVYVLTKGDNLMEQAEKRVSFSTVFFLRNSNSVLFPQ